MSIKKGRELKMCLKRGGNEMSFNFCNDFLLCCEFSCCKKKALKKVKTLQKINLNEKQICIFRAYKKLRRIKSFNFKSELRLSFTMFLNYNQPQN